jgi:hypothetical protein
MPPVQSGDLIEMAKGRVVTAPAQKVTGKGNRRSFHSAAFCQKHFQERAAEPQVPPLRCAPVGMTRGRDCASRSRFSSPWVGQGPMTSPVKMTNGRVATARSRGQGKRNRRPQQPQKEMAEPRLRHLKVTSTVARRWCRCRCRRVAGSQTSLCLFLRDAWSALRLASDASRPARARSREVR